MKYRADIDGLRAVAVLSVLVFHIDPSWMPGGFAGVDVFFVISGFLITRIIGEQVEAGRFTLTGFYRNRINRIFPALFAVVAACLLAGLVLLSPQELVLLGKSALATVLGVSNVLYWREYGGYFGAAAHEAPLLHTWSLAVEEQFYVVWPLMLMVLLHPRLRRHATWTIALLVVILAGVSELGTRQFASASYYLLPMRFFELAMGGLASLRVARGLPLLRPAVAAGMALAGLALVVGSFWLLRGTAFPGVNAVYPCLGTALVILAGSQGPNPVSRLLAWRGAVFVGLISYSLYLWHWPVITAFNYFYIDSGLPRALAITTLSIALAWLSWRYVEQPFRHGREPFRHVFLRRYLAPVAGLALVVGLLVIMRGLPQRFPAALEAMEAAHATQPNLLRARCHVPSFLYDTPPDASCVLGDRRQPVSGLLFGDSFANHFSAMVDELALASGVALQDYTMNACLPLAGLAPGAPRSYADKCRRRNDAVYARVDAGQYRYVLLGGEWPDAQALPRYLEGELVSESDFRAAVAASLRRSLARIVASGATPVVIRRNAAVPHAATCPMRRVMLGLERDCDAPRVADPMDALWVELSQEVPALRFIDPNLVLCAQGNCRVMLAGTPLYRDDGHLNDAGSRLLGQHMVAAGMRLPGVAPAKEAVTMGAAPPTVPTVGSAPGKASSRR